MHFVSIIIEDDHLIRSSNDALCHQSIIPLKVSLRPGHPLASIL